LPAISKATWAFNRQQMKILLDGVTALRDIEYAKVEAEGEVPVRSGSNASANKIVRQYDLEYVHRKIENKVGSLTVEASLDGVYSRLINRVWLILISNGVKTFLVAIFLYFLFGRLVTRHLTRITNFTENLSTDRLTDNLALDGINIDQDEVWDDTNDEIIRLVVAIKRMQENLITSNQALYESEAQQRSILNNTSSVIHIKNLDKRYIFINQKFEEVVKIPKAEIIGKTDHELFSRKLADELVANDLKVIEASRPLEFEETVLRDDGVHTYLSVKFPLRNLSEEAYATCGISTDITMRKQAERALSDSEERLKLSLRSGRIGTFEWNIQEGSHFWDDQMHNIWGLKPGTYQGITEADFLDYLHPDDAERFNETVTRTLEGDGDYDIEYRIILPNGSTHHVHALASLVKDEQGQPARLTGVCLDITDRKNLEEQLRQSQKMEAVGHLTGGVAHDFNNLLAVIMGNLELVQDSGNLEDDKRQNLHRAITAVDRGASLTDQLLSFSRQQTLNPKIGNANALIADMTMLLVRTLGEDIDIRTTFSRKSQLISVDPALLGNAILNMAINSRDAMPDGGVLLIETDEVELDGEFNDDSGTAIFGPHVVITVSDEGSGMDNETLEHVFDPFYTTKAVGEGTGLGLSMVYGFVNQSGGHVTIDSEKGIGTTIKLYFPVTDKRPEDTDHQATTGEARQKGSGTILVVEDDEDVRMVTVSLLGQLNYEVLEAEDGPSALKLLENNDKTVDLVFSDVIMPSGMNGYDLARELRHHHKDIRVLMTSGYPEQVIEKDLHDGTEYTLLRKPYKKDELGEAVRTALEK
jgi:PAS domain S-box-containing protein